MVRPLGREGSQGRRGDWEEGGGLIRSRRVALMQSHQPVSGCYGTVTRARAPFQIVFGPTNAINGKFSLEYDTKFVTNGTIIPLIR